MVPTPHDELLEPIKTWLQIKGFQIDGCWGKISDPHQRSSSHDLVPTGKKLAYPEENFEGFRVLEKLGLPSIGLRQRKGALYDQLERIIGLS